MENLHGESSKVCINANISIPSKSLKNEIVVAVKKMYGASFDTRTSAESFVDFPQTSRGIKCDIFEQ